MADDIVEADALVERLRGRASWYRDQAPVAVKSPDLMDEAATEIESLRAELVSTQNRALDYAAASGMVPVLRARVAVLEGALKPFLGDATMEGILWGDLPDDATGSVTVQLKHFRAARRALTPVAETPNQDGKI